jgi:hypothetical protein
MQAKKTKRDEREEVWAAIASVKKESQPTQQPTAARRYVFHFKLLHVAYQYCDLGVLIYTQAITQ